VNGRDHGQCLAEETLIEYLEGSLDPAIKAASEVHLIGCDECRVRLGFFMKILKEEVSPEEAGAVRAIDEQWHRAQRELPRRKWMLSTRLTGLLAVAAVLLAAVIAGRFLLNRPAEPKSASEVVQLLLAEHRPFESRLANEPHLPIVQTRGGDEPGIAYGVLAGEMTRLAADSHQMGRFYLLQKDFNRSIPYLEIAEREVGAGAAVHNDLGVAYLESGSHIDKAGEEFRHALTLDPAFAPAVFNLALFCERTNSAGQAAVQWKRYLQLDSKSQWATEARERLEGLSR
jgi:tetratricopeptide (TPR) repeat protein